MSLLDNEEILAEKSDYKSAGEYYKPINKILGGCCMPGMIALNKYNRFMVFDSGGYWKIELSKDCLLILIQADAKIEDLLPEHLDDFIETNKDKIIKEINDHNAKRSLIGHIDMNGNIDNKLIWDKDSIKIEKTNNNWGGNGIASITNIASDGTIKIMC